MKSTPLLALAGLLLLMPTDHARASSITVSTGETLDVTGTSTETTPPTGNNTSFTGFLTIGSLVPSTSDWTVTAFHLDVEGLPLLAWTFSGLLFDASNNTLVGIPTVPYTDSTGPRLITANFLDSNTSTNTYSNLGTSNHRGDSTGTFGYTVSSTPEPSSGLLLLLGLGFAVLVAKGVNFSRRLSRA
jgi:hypothetical protein